MIGFNIADVTAISLGSIEISSIYAGNSVIWEDTPDYEKKYLTTVAKGSGNIVFNIPAGLPTNYLTSISYSTDNGSTWTTTNKVDNQEVTVTVPVNNGDKVLWKGVGTATSNNLGYSYFTSTTNFDVEGNIMSLLNGDNFYQSGFAYGSSYNYYNLFNNASIVDASNLILPATTLTDSCYSCMFCGCTLLTTTPELPATTLAKTCYSNMFQDCTSLTTAPELPATTLTDWCYASMFYGCTSLTTAPELSATTLANGCYSNMFNGCTNLNYIMMMTTDVSATYCLNNWVNGVAATGTFVKDASATIPTGTSGIPSGWTVENYNKYEHQYFTTVAKGSGNIVFNISSGISTTYLTSISYSTDNGSTWTTTNNVNGQAINVTVPVNNGDKVLWKGVGTTMFDPNYNTAYFTSTVSFDVEGNIMSLLNGDNFYQSSFVSGSSYNFANIFNGTSIVDASNLILPATNLTVNCFNGTFNGCTSLTTAPTTLSATVLAESCYVSMFIGCTSLTTAPELPATTLARWCYSGMFNGCTNLKYIKMLATDISATNCLNDWVNNVAATGTFVKDANTNIPTGTSGIPSGWTVQNIGDYEQQYFTTVARESGNIVFNIPSNVTTTYVTSISYSTDNGSTWTTTNNVNSQDVTVTVPVNNGDKVLWKGVANAMRDGLYGYTKFTTTIDYDVEGNIMSLLNGDNFYHSSFASGYTSNLYKLFENNNIIDASNLVIPATTLKDYCYEDMFNGCTKLTAAPALPATTLVEGCYKHMFNGCSHLNYIKMLATDISANSCLFQWVYAVQAGGTFVKNASMTTLPTGASGIPSGWTVQDAA